MFWGLRGLLPPLLTVVLIVALCGMVRQYVLLPVQGGLNWLLANWVARSIVAGEEPEGTSPEAKNIDGQRYQLASDGRYVPEHIYATVRSHEGLQTVGAYTAWQLCRQYVTHVYLRSYLVIPALLAFFILVMYFLGKLLSRRVVQFVWRSVEQLVRKVPLVRNVYSSAQQVTAFLIERRNLRNGEVVAVEYPRSRMWTLGYVTGDALREVAEAAGEPLISVLVDTSPVPFIGFTCMVSRREVVELKISIDQALQYVISCGVIVPGKGPRSK